MEVMEVKEKEEKAVVEVVVKVIMKVLVPELAWPPGPACSLFIRPRHSDLQSHGLTMAPRPLTDRSTVNHLFPHFSGRQGHYWLLQGKARLPLNFPQPFVNPSMTLSLLQHPYVLCYRSVLPFFVFFSMRFDSQKCRDGEMTMVSAVSAVIQPPPPISNVAVYNRTQGNGKGCRSF